MVRFAACFLALPLATALWAQPDKTAWDLLSKGMLDKNPEIRRQAIRAIASIGLAPEAVRLLEQALHDQDASIRQIAAAGLGEMKAKQSIPALKTLLEDSNGEVSFAAAKALWEVGDHVIESVEIWRRSQADIKLRPLPP